MPYLSPDAPPPGEFYCRVLRVPATPEFLSIVDGALSELCKPKNFEEFGDLTPEETASIFLDMWLDQHDNGNECPVGVTSDVFIHQVAQNVAGGGITANADTFVPFPTALPHGAGNVAWNVSGFVVQPGLYHVSLNHWVRSGANAGCICWLLDTAWLTIHTEGLHTTLLANNPEQIGLSTLVDVSAVSYFELQCRVTQATATSFFGLPRNVAGHAEAYGFAEWIRLGE